MATCNAVANPGFELSSLGAWTAPNCQQGTSHGNTSPIQGSQMLVVTGATNTITQSIPLCAGTSKLQVSAFAAAWSGNCKVQVCIGSAGCSPTTTVTTSWQEVDWFAAVSGSSVTISFKFNCNPSVGSAGGLLDWVVVA